MMIQESNQNNDEIYIPENISKYPLHIQTNIINYIKSMNKLEKTAYFIAIEHLGSSFNLVKSNGYSEWCKKNNA